MKALRALLAAESAFAARFGWEAQVARLSDRVQRIKDGCPVRDQTIGHRLHHLPTISRLWWVLQRLDRYADFGAGRTGAGLRLLEALLDGHAEDVAEGRAGAPRHLGYFLPALEETGRRWKHQQAPRIKDRRIAEGKRPQRRAPGRPGRGPVLGYDPKVTHFPRSRRRRGGQEGSGQ